jgi:hypothetical protein
MDHAVLLDSIKYFLTPRCERVKGEASRESPRTEAVVEGGRRLCGRGAPRDQMELHDPRTTYTNHTRPEHAARLFAAPVRVY